MYNMILFYQKERKRALHAQSIFYAQRGIYARSAILTIFHDTRRYNIDAFTICSVHIIMFDFLSTSDFVFTYLVVQEHNI